MSFIGMKRKNGDKRNKNGAIANDCPVFVILRFLFHRILLFNLILRFHAYFRRYDQRYRCSNHNPHHDGEHPLIPPLSSFYLFLFYMGEQAVSSCGFEQFMKFNH
jgi:hypothetical protein